MAAVQEQRLRVWQDRVETRVDVRGAGAPLVFLHGPWGLRTDGDFLDLLAQDHQVYAPRHPGTNQSDPDAIYQLDSWWDLIVYYGELFDRLQLGTPDIVGHSFGGMLACELAAIVPSRVGKLVLIDPVGLWREDLPVRNWMIVPADERRRTFFADPEGEAARRFFALPEEHNAHAEALAAFIWAQACTGKFVWPIPDRGLKKHIHRISAPTLIVWGENDAVISPTYAQEFASRIASSHVELVKHAGHLPHLEQPALVAQHVNAFL